MKVIKGYKVNNKKVKGLGGNVKYFKTSFVPSDYSDKNKILLTKKATDMICIKENTFENIINKNKYKIFKNNNNFTFIIYDQLVLDEIKKIIPKYKGNIKKTRFTKF